MGPRSRLHAFSAPLMSTSTTRSSGDSSPADLGGKAINKRFKGTEGSTRKDRNEGSKEERREEKEEREGKGKEEQSKKQKSVKPCNKKKKK